MSAPASFAPPPWLANSHLQTLCGSLVAPCPRVAYRRERWDTPDGDFVDVDRIDAPASAPCVVLFHGLEGSSGSPYARMLMDRVRRRGWRGAVLNFRGCSGEPNRLPRAYHSGDSAELDWVLRRLRAESAVPLYAAGVSLGGNALLKWLGERGAEARTIVERAAAVSAPVDLTAAGYALERGFALVYGKHFLWSLRPRSRAKLARFPRIFDAHALERARTLREFDDAVTAPLHGFRDVDDYYTRSSARPWLGAVRVPTLMLNARDDPFLPASALPPPEEVSESVTIEFPLHGGHVGFVTGPFPGRIEWLAARLLHFFDERP